MGSEMCIRDSRDCVLLVRVDHGEYMGDNKIEGKVMKNSIVSVFAAMAVLAAVPVSAIAQDGATVQTAEEAARPSVWDGKPFAVGGQDVVSYQTEGGPVLGSEEFTAN